MAQLIGHKQVASGVWCMQLRHHLSAFQPGTFVNISIPGFYLRRPFAIADAQDETLTLYYKVVGNGTKTMTELPIGCEVDILSPLGNGFSDCGDAPLLVGGGAGVGPIYAQAKYLSQLGRRVTVALGFRAQADCYLIDEFQALGCELLLATEDGSLGAKGFVTNLLQDAHADYFYTCGPTPMMQAVCRTLTISGEVSLEERMACGFGACVGCAVETKQGMKRVCKDGPVFNREVLGW